MDLVFSQARNGEKKKLRKENVKKKKEIKKRDNIHLLSLLSDKCQNIQRGN